MVRIALLGAAIAGPYGALHDQISYSIAPEYFTKLKFKQFSYADFGWPPRVFAAEVGFLATWWVGLLAGWFLARAGLAAMPHPARRRCLIRAFAILLVVGATIGLLGALTGVAVTRGDLSAWRGVQQNLQVVDVRGFVIVAFLHWAGYIGGLIGLIAAILYVRRCRAAGDSV
jgi:hypothetical protein